MIYSVDGPRKVEEVTLLYFREAHRVEEDIRPNDIGKFRKPFSLSNGLYLGSEWVAAILRGLCVGLIAAQRRKR